MNQKIIELRNEYAKLKNKSFDNGLEGGFMDEYVEWLEGNLAINTDIIGNVSKSEFMQLFEKARNVADLYNAYTCTNTASEDALEELQLEIGGHEDKPYYSC